MAAVQAATLMEKDLPVYLDTPAVRGAFDRIGIPVEYAAPNFNLYLHTISGIESSFGKNLSNKDRVGASGTSAKGTYQIVDGTYLTMLNRGARSYKMEGEEVPSWITEARNNPDRNPRDLTPDQEKELIILDMEQRPQKDENGVGTSVLMRNLAMGDWDAGRALFDDHHHTNPDEATIKRTDNYFDRFAGNVTQIIEQSAPVKAPKIEQYADLNNPETEPSIPAQKLGDLNIEDYDAAPSIAAQSLDLQNIVIPDSAKKILLEDIEVPERDRVPKELLQEVNVDAKRVPKELLQEVNVDAKRVPKELLQDIVVPERAKKILFENIEVPDREQKEVPAPYTDYTSTMDQRLTEVTTPERQQVPTELLQEVTVPDRELTDPLQPQGITIPQSALDAINPPAKRRSPDDIVIPQSAIDIRKN